MKKLVEYKYKASYFISHEPSNQEKDVWLIFHGYGQLAEFFLRKFRSFDSPDRLIIAPEGTNHCYLEGFGGRVGANWMTSHDRDLAIANNDRFLDKLMEDILRNFEKDEPRIHILGFSQGAATATRWASRWSISVESLILWAGGFAADMDVTFAKDIFLDTKITVVFGSQDKLMTDESIAKQDIFLSQLGKKSQKIVFEGGHELDMSVLEKIFLL